MKVSEALAKLQKMVAEGHGDAVLVHSDTRSGVTENCHIGSVQTLESEGDDFYADVEVGEEYLPIYEGS